MLIISIIFLIFFEWELFFAEQRGGREQGFAASEGGPILAGDSVTSATSNYGRVHLKPMLTANSPAVSNWFC